MLPPIILDAGYFMPNRLFFDHLGTILLMAVVGTIFNAMTIGSALYACGKTGAFGDDPPNILESFLFSSLISAVDPVAVLAVFEEIHVDEILYIVVFGESLLNDAVTVVLYHMFEAYVEIGEENIGTSDLLKGFASFLVVALGGTVVGIIWGYVTGFVTRFTNHARILEPLFVFTMAYLSYLTAEIFHLSGILAITFCGITMKNYVERNISSKSQTTLKYAMKMLSGSSETIIFMFLGVATIHDEHDWNTAFVVCTILFCTVFRIIGVLILTALANNYRLHKLAMIDQFVMMYGGLRGAVAFALVLLIDEKTIPHFRMFRTATIAMVYWTVFVQGITIKPLVKFLNVKTSSEKDPSMNERIAGRFMDHVVAGMEGILGELGNLRVRDMYKRIDDRYIKPWMLRENHSIKDPKIIETYQHLTETEALKLIKEDPSQFAKLASSKTFTELSTLNLNGSTSELNGSASEDQVRRASVIQEDPHKAEYRQTQEDMDENNIHHVLSENMFTAGKKPRKFSYSRHTIVDGDNSSAGNNYKLHMQVRRMMSDGRIRRRTKAGQAAGANGTVGRNHAEEVPTMPATIKHGKRVTGSAKVLQDDKIRKANVDEDQEGEDEFISFSTKRPFKPGDIEMDGPSVPWMFKKHSLGQTNEAFIEDEVQRDDEAIQSKALPWRRSADEAERPKLQEEFVPWIMPSTVDSPSNTVTDTNRRSSDEIPSVIGFFNRRESGASLTSGNHRRNSELEMKHQDGLNEADIEARRQKRSLKKQQRKNTASISEEPTTPPDDNTKL